MELEGKICSRCDEFKPLAEYYKQGSRHESLCKSCKKLSRTTRKVPVEQDKDEASSQQKSSPKSVKPKTEVFERDQMPMFDESIFYPEQSRRTLGISDDDMDVLVAYFRWQLEQREKRKK